MKPASGFLIIGVVGTLLITMVIASSIRAQQISNSPHSPDEPVGQPDTGPDGNQHQPPASESEAQSGVSSKSEHSNDADGGDSGVIPFDEELAISIIEGEGTFSEKLRRMGIESHRRRGLPPPPELKHQQQMDRVYALIEQHGLPRQDLFEYYGPLLRQAVEVPEGPFSTPRTHELYQLIRSADWDAVDEFIEARLEENAYDLPALLIRFDLHVTQMKIEEMFEDMEFLIPAIADLEPQEFDRRAVLYQVLDRMEMVAYASDEWVERNRERADSVLERGSAATQSLFLLRFLEIDGLF